MSRWRSLVVIGLVLGQTACADWGAGCVGQPLDSPLAPERIGPRAVEFYLPQERILGWGPELLAALEAQGDGRLRAEIPAVSGPLDQISSFQVVPFAIDAPVAWLQGESGEGGLSLRLGVEAATVATRLALDSSQGPSEECDLELTQPERSAFVHLVLDQADDGRALLRVDGTPRLAGAPLELTLGPGCSLQTTALIEAGVSDALAAGLQEAFVAWTGALAGVCERALGVDLGVASRLGDGLRLSLLPDPVSTSLEAGQTRLGLAGGFDSGRAACVPVDRVLLAPTTGAPAAFDDRLPKSGEPYSLGVSVSRLYLEQGLTAVQRAGMLCRRCAQGDLVGVDPASALPSLQALGPIDGVRAAVWPQGRIGVEWGLPDPEQDERLPRVLVILPQTRLDVYVRMDGADLRVLGGVADITLVIAPSLTGHELRLRLAATQVAGLTLDKAELITEKAGALRDAAKLLIGQVAAVWIDELGPLPLTLPTTAGPQLLEYRLAGDQLLLYF